MIRSDQSDYATYASQRMHEQSTYMYTYTTYIHTYRAGWKEGRQKDREIKGGVASNTARMNE